MKRFKWQYGLIAVFAVLAIAAAILFLPHLFDSGDGNGHALLNGDFSQLDDRGMPRYWEKDGYGTLTDVTFRVETQEDGAKAAHISSLTAHDARFAQQVAVEPDTLYCLHGWVKAQAAGGLGANLSIAGVYAFSDPVYDSHEEWKEIFLYGRTQKDQTSVTVFIRLGGYSGETSGDAWFRDISLEAVTQVPDGSKVLYWGISSEKTDSGTNITASTGKGFLILCTLLWAALFSMLLAFFRRQEHRPTVGAHRLNRQYLLTFVLLMALGFIARIAVSLLVPGYDVDINCFTGWARRMSDVGPMEFYSGYFCDYPPGYLLVLWVLGALENFFGIGVNEFLVKLPPILADMGLCMILYSEAKKTLSQPAALSLTAMYLFNPLIIVTGAAWGQADAVMVLLLALTVLFAARGRWSAALPCYVAAVLIKPQALMFGPLGLCALILYIITETRKGKHRKAWTDAGLGLFISLALAALVIVPFSIHQSWDWLIRLYAKTMSYYDRATVNGCNLYFLLGHNWNPIAVNISAMPLLSLLTFAMIALPLAGVWLKRTLIDREPLRASWSIVRLEALGSIVLAHGLYLLLTAAAGRLTFSILGTVMISLCVMVTCAQFLFSRDLRSLPIYGAICLLVLFNTGIMMHERYLVPAVALLLLGYALQEKKDNRLLWLAAGVTVTGFLNVACVLNRNIRIGGVKGHLDTPIISLQSDLAGLEYLAAALNPILCMLSVAYGSVLCHEPNRDAIRTISVKFRRGLLVTVVTAVYAVMAFTNLGSMKAPQTAWVSASPDEQVTLDLGDCYSFHLAYFGGIHQYDSDFTVEISIDGRSWDDSYTAGMKIGDCFKWKYLSEYVQGAEPADLFGRYIRITADHYDLTLFEVLALDSFTHTPLELSPVSAVSDTDALTDEPNVPEPKNAWRAEMPGDQVVLDLGEERFFHFSYCGESSAHGADFTLEISSDLENWVSYQSPMGADEPLQWQKLSENGTPLKLWGRYIRITAEQTDLTLYEVAATNPWTDDALPLQTVDVSSAASALVDEPDTMEGEPGWYNSTYFDEIYHARTGYELLHGLQPYEWTHPPLGKVLMSWCIALFGMTPFGWRFAGALAGVLMLPGMYLLGSILTRRKWGGPAAMLLMAFDLMHFTQTRIATIDSFVVLFIIWMIYFMLRWFRQDFFRMKFLKTLLPLFLSGIMLGLAISSKWTGVYAAVGVAVIFFWGLVRRILQICKARRVPAGMRDDASRAAAVGWPRILATVGCCFVFFIFIPLLIYYCSYIPFFGKYDPDGISVIKVIQQAVGPYFTDGTVGGMLGYHSQPGLGMDHYFYSPWYQWPIIAKPMWYASSSFETEGFQSSIMAMGNPAVWWPGLIALFTVLCLWMRRHVNKDYTLALHPRRQDSRYALLLICFFAQYLPWMLVPRGTYIYHYFPLVPFIILCTVFCLDLLSEKHRKGAQITVWALVAAAAVLMVIFFPYASGMEAPQSWMDGVKWFDRWLWY